MKDLRSMQYELLTFETEDNQPFRTVEIDGNPWFVLADVCRALGLAGKDGYYGHYAERLDDDEKQVVERTLVNRSNPPPLGEGGFGGPTITVISESGLYSLVLRSRLPGAKRFRKWITSEVLPSIRRTGKYGGGAAAFIRRYNDNWDRVDVGHFSVISELVWWLWGRLSHVGHIMADRAPDGRELRPDIAVGQRFAEYLRQHHPEYAECHKFYWHKTPEALVEARQYPDEVLAIFRKFVDTVWIPGHSRDYFKSRDPKALPYLPALLPGAQKSAVPRPRPSIPALRAS